jgi:hypothetical protein
MRFGATYRCGRVVAGIDRPHRGSYASRTGRTYGTGTNISGAGVAVCCATTRTRCGAAAGSSDGLDHGLATKKSGGDGAYGDDADGARFVGVDTTISSRDDVDSVDVGRAVTLAIDVRFSISRVNRLQYDLSCRCRLAFFFDAYYMYMYNDDDAAAVMTMQWSADAIANQKLPFCNFNAVAAVVAG